jgi:hypothetical protein
LSYYDFLVSQKDFNESDFNKRDRIICYARPVSKRLKNYVLTSINHIPDYSSKEREDATFVFEELCNKYEASLLALKQLNAKKQ